MAFYIRVIEIMLLCLKINLTQTVTALNDKQKNCCDRMVVYCNTKEPIHDIEEYDQGEEVYDGKRTYESEQVSSKAKLREWQRLTIHDCAKAEVLFWKSDAAEFYGYMADYRDDILGNLVFGNFRLPQQFCNEFEEDLNNPIAQRNCFSVLSYEFGNTHDEIHTYAVQKSTLTERVKKSVQYFFIKEIASVTTVADNAGIEDPYKYCINKFSDDDSSFTTDSSPELSEIDSFSNYEFAGNDI